MIIIAIEINGLPDLKITTLRKQYPKNHVPPVIRQHK